MSVALYFGPFRLDVSGHRLWEGEREVPLAPKALELLVFLASNAGRVIAREQLFKQLWPDIYVDDHALSVQISDIRKALHEDVKKPTYIVTRHRIGYCFNAEVQRVQAVGAGSMLGSDTSLEAPRPLPQGERDDMPVPETRYAHNGDVNIAYQVLGNGPMDLIFVMGWVSHIEYFWKEPRLARFLRRLASFARLIVFDKRGTGLSDRVPISELPTIEQRMSDLRAVMEAAGSERAAICGISEGGPMSAVFAATYPERTIGLVMIGTYAKRIRDVGYPWGSTREERERYIREILDHWGGPIGIEDRAPSLAADPQFREWWSTYLRMGSSPGAAAALTKMNAEIDVRRVLPAISVPTLVMHRAGDQCLRVEEGRYVASCIPGARFIELPGNDHLPFVGDQDAILNEIESFLSNLTHSTDPERTLATVMVADPGPRPPGTPLGQFRTELDAEVKWFGGREAGSNGRHAIATFEGPARAVRCACAIVARAASVGHAASAGIHTGECKIADRLVGGPAPEVARALQSRAAKGEVLISGTVRDLVAGSGLQFEPRGTLAIDGIEGEWQALSVQRCWTAAGRTE